MNIVILDDYQDVVRKLSCASKLEAYPAKVYTNTIKGVGQLSVRLRDAEVLVLIRERTHITRQLLDKLPKLKLISQTGKIGSHVDVAACTERGIAVAEGSGSPIAPAELTWALIMAAMRRLPQYISNLKHGAWQQSGFKAGSMPTNFGLGQVLRGKTLGIWGYGKIGKLLAGYGKAFGMRVLIWGSDASLERAAKDGLELSAFRNQLRNQLLLSRLHEREVTSRIRVSDQDIDRFIQERLESNADPFTQDINLAQLLIAVPEKASAEQAGQLYLQAQKVLDRIRAGEDFNQLVQQLSEADRKNDGQLGLRRADRYPPSFILATQKLNVGEVSDLVRSGAATVQGSVIYNA